MSTRSSITLKRKDGKYQGVYCYFDGYIDGVGKTLVNTFNTYSKVQELIDLGDLSVVCDAGNINEVEAYHRDRGEELQPARIYDTYEEILNTVGQGCDYLFENGEWIYKGYEDTINLSKKFDKSNFTDFFKDKSHSFRKRFVKDFNLPIQVIQSPYFEYSLETLNKQFNIEEKVKMLVDIMETMKTEDEFFCYTNTLIDKILIDLEYSEEYKNFKNIDMSDYNPICNIKGETLYQEKNIGKTFFSIDLVKANFQALKYVGIIKQNNFEDFISEYTPFEYFKEAKYFRQVVFGKLNPKRQQKIQKYLVSLIANELELFDREVFSFTSDEIIFASENLDKDDIEQKLNELNIDVHFDEFILYDLRSKKDELFYVKEFYNKFEFKKVPAHFFLQAFKKWHDKEITEYDRKFYYEGYISTFDETVF